MGRNAQLAAALHEGLAVVVFVGAHGLLAPTAPLAPQHLERRLVLCRAVGMGDLDVHHQAVAVVHQDVAHVAQPRLVALGFLVQARIGIGAAGMGVVGTLLAFEVAAGLSRASRAVPKGGLCAHTRLRTRRSYWRARHRPARAACARGAGAIPGLQG